MAGVSAVGGRTRWASQIFSNMVRGFMGTTLAQPPVAPSSDNPGRIR